MDGVQHANYWKIRKAYDGRENHRRRIQGKKGNLCGNNTGNVLSWNHYKRADAGKAEPIKIKGNQSRLPFCQNT